MDGKWRRYDEKNLEVIVAAKRNKRPTAAAYNFLILHVPYLHSILPISSFPASTQACLERKKEIERRMVEEVQIMFINSWRKKSFTIYLSQSQPNTHSQPIKRYKDWLVCVGMRFA